MLRFSQIQKEIGPHVCRRCINNVYGTELEPDDCVYESPYPRRCSCCGEMRRIVVGLHLSGKLMLLRTRR